MLDENTMKLMDRLLVAERMNAILEMRIKRVQEEVWKAEREEADYIKERGNKYCTKLESINIHTSKIREAAGFESEADTVKVFEETPETE